MRLLTALLGGLAAGLLTSAVHAAGPGNNKCATATALDAAPGQVFHGTITRSGGWSYYKTSGAPGADLQVFVYGQQSQALLNQPWVEVFDAQCKRIAQPADELFHDSKQKVRFTVPADGQYVFGVTDVNFETGAWLGRITPYTPPRVIQGLVTDSQGQPLGWSPVVISQCTDVGNALCTQWVGQAYTDDQGRYSFAPEVTWYLDAAASFQLAVRDWTNHTNGPQSSRPFLLKSSTITHDFVLAPPPVRIASVDWSGTVPAGSSATLTATLENPGTKSQTLDVWLGVTAPTTDDMGGSTWFQSGRAGGAEPVRVKVAPGQTLEVAIPVALPADAPVGTWADLLLQVAKAGEPTTVYANSLMGYVIGPAGVQLQSPKAAQARKARELALRRASLLRATQPHATAR